MTKVSSRRIALGLILLVTPFVFSFDNPSERYFEISKNMEILTSVYAEVNRYYVDDVDPNKLMKTGIDAMLESLDPYTNYIPEDAIEDFRFISTGQYGGIGSMIGTRNDKVLILMPYEGFPAHEAGLKIGDEIVEINGKDVKGNKTHEISKLLKGQADTQVDLKIKRYGQDQLLDIDIVRKKIQVKSVPFHDMINDEVGYFKLSSFTQDASDEVKKAIEALQDQGAKKFIFDLRGNTGGLLREAIEISNFFIPRGKEIVSTRGKVEKWNDTHHASRVALLPDAELVILVNGRSASASEIVSGVIQDYDRGVLIGSQTFGKGLVQATLPTAYNSQVKITTAKYYIPSGRCIQAIDYSNKGEDGHSKKIPDSLLVEHKTANGRKVFDGAGIAPDVKIEKDPMGDVLVGLISQNMIFDYATEYFYTRDSITDPRAFKLSEEDYQGFKGWLVKKEFKFKSQAERRLESFKKEIGKDSLEIDFTDEFELMANKIESDKVDDLDAYKEQVIEMLEEEIVSRYFLQRGLIEASFDDDQDIISALDILSNRKKYDKLLGVTQ